MKTTKLTIAALIMSTLSFGAFAAQEINSTTAAPQGEKIGVVSASGAYTLSELESELAAKADAAGASSFKITSASGYNLMHGTAEIYK
ncbi:DUF1471 domain-containing protein [Enterobacteriaceae bacterium 4M9]|nr:DUF1471 domain-containing protein [Enterobacteriaceae bacterium 4M9]